MVSKKDALVHLKKIVGVSTAYRRKYDTSPIFQFSNGAVTASGFEVIDIELDKPTAWKYAPFTNLKISNNSGNEIILFPNQDQTQAISILSGTIQVLDQKTIRGLTSFSYQNKGSTTLTANTIRFEVWKEAPTTDLLVQNIHRRLFGGETF